MRPYLVGDDITEEPEQRPRRFVVDFALRSLEEAMRYPDALQRVRDLVKPERDKNRDEAYRRYWWRFDRAPAGMRKALDPLSRFIAGNAQGKRFLFCWAEPTVCPSNLTNVFAFEDDYAMGVLTSSIHGAWAKSESSTLEIVRATRRRPVSKPSPAAAGHRHAETNRRCRQAPDRKPPDDLRRQ